MDKAREQKKKDDEARANEESLKQQIQKLQTSSEYNRIQNTNENIKYKMTIKDLEG